MHTSDAMGYMGPTLSDSAALFRSNTPSGAASTRATNFFVSSPSELSYRQLPVPAHSKRHHVSFYMHVIERPSDCSAQE